MKRRILAAVALAAVVGVTAAPADAAVSAVGWWSRNPSASAPDGGLQVANGLDGVISFGAVRAVEDGDIESATLTLQESGQTLPGAGASLKACPAAGTWTPGKGTWADAPKADCKAATVPLTRNAQGQWTADVTSVLTGATPALAVVPGDGANVFQVSFTAPALDVKVRKASGSGSGSSSNFDASEFTAPATTSPSSGSGGSSGPSPQSSTFEPSSSGSFSSTSSGAPGSFASTFEAATPLQEVAATVDASAGVEGDTGDAASGSTFVARPAAAPPLEVAGNRWAQYGLFLAVAAVIGTVAGIGRNRLVARSA